MPYVGYGESLYVGRLIERSKFDSIWFSDHVIGIGNVPALEQWSLLNILAYTTRGLEYGFATTDIYRRPPHTLAQQITTTDIISKGNFICGVGAGEAMNLKPYGIRMERPVSRLVETVKLMKKLWTEEFVNYEGDFYTYKKASLPLENIRKPHPPIWIGGIGPRMQEITAELGDGWIPYGQTADLYKEKLDNILAVRKKYGGSQLDRGIYIPTGVAEGRDTAIERFGPIGKHIALLFPQFLIETGHEDLVVEGIDLVNFSYDQESQRKIEKESENVPFDLVEDMCIIGAPDDAIEKIEEFRKAGVEHFALDLFGDMGAMKDTIEIYRDKIIPYFKGG